MGSIHFLRPLKTYSHKK